MMRLAVVIGFSAAAVLAFLVYQGGNATREQEARLRRIERQIAAEQAAMRVLKADWALLTKPERLHDLSQRHLALAPVAAIQFTQFASLPMRGGAPARALTLQDVPKRAVILQDAPKRAAARQH